MKKYILLSFIAMFLTVEASASEITFVDKTTGSTFTASDAQQIKTAVNDNDSRITVLEDGSALSGDAADITVVDVGGYFDTANVEAVLAEVGLFMDGTSAFSEAGNYDFSGDLTLTGSFDVSGGVFTMGPVATDPMDSGWSLSEKIVQQGDVYKEITDGSLDWLTSGTISGNVYWGAGSASRALIEQEYRGGGVIVSASSAYTLPVPVIGYSTCFLAGYGATVAIGMTPSAGTYIVKSGVRGTAGTTLTSAGAAAEKLCLTAISTTDWRLDTAATTTE